MDVPFVSEEFQRAFRNRFPSQTSTGRDLHVSDVVIPTVDFTPTASGASLPLDLRDCLNGNTAYAENNTDASSTSLISSGFWQTECRLLTTNTGTSNGARLFLKLYNQGVEYKTLVRLSNYDSKIEQLSLKDKFFLFVPTGHTAGYEFYTGSADTAYFTIRYTPIADSNGTLLSPYNYDPQ